MTDVSGKFFSAKKVRTGVSPSSPGVQVGETLPPVNPPGTSLNSVGLTMPSAFAVANSPLTSNGTIAVTGAGTVAQYVRGDGTLADFPESSGGGSSVSYYLNGSVSQGTIGGVAYREMNKVPILGAGTDFTIAANGYIASFITDAGDPNLLEIPGGNWNFESYFSASSGGGSPTFYVELYKVNAGGTATLIASNSANPELISFGTTIAPYFSSLAVPTTVLALTDRLAVRYYVTHSGRTITLHTEGPHLCQIITTFTTGLTSLNGLNAQVQFFAVGTSGTDFNIASATATHTFNLPTASATNRGALSSADWSMFNAKENAITAGTTAQYFRGDKTFQTLNTSVVPEGTNLYYTDGRARGALSFAAGSGAYNSSTGVITIPTNNNQITNGAGYITSAALAGYLPLTGGTLTGPLNGTSASFSNTLSVQNNASNQQVIIEANRGTGPSNTCIFEMRNTNATSNKVQVSFGGGTVASGYARTFSFGVDIGGVGVKDFFVYNGATTNTPFIITPNDRVIIGNTGISYSDLGYRLDVLGTARVTGAATFTGALNGTSASFSTSTNNTTFPSLFLKEGSGSAAYAQISGVDYFHGLILRGVPANSTDYSVTAGDQMSFYEFGGDFRFYKKATGILQLQASIIDGAGNFISSLTATSFIKSGGTSSQFLKADGSVDSTAYGTGSVTSVAALTLGTSGTDLSSTVANGTTTPVITLNVPTASATNRGALSAADWTTFNNKQNALTNPVTGTGTTNYLPKFTGSTSIGNSNLINDASGNLGLGVTPSAWTLFSGVLELNGGPAIGGFANTTYFLQNANFDSGFKYKTTGTAGRYELGGQHSWWIAPSGTAGNSVSFTQAMTLFSSGNLAIGPTSDAGFKLDVNGTGRFVNAVLGGTGSAFADGLRVNRNSNTNQYTVINHVGGATNIISVDQTGNNIPEIYFGRSINGSTITNSMVIDKSGNVGIATNSPSYLFTVGQAGTTQDSVIQIASTTTGTGSLYFGDTTGTFVGSRMGGFQYSHFNDLMVVLTAGVEQMRILSSGNVLIGTTTDSGDRLRVNGTTFTNEIRTFLPEADSVSTPWRFGTASNASITPNRRLRVNVGGIEYYIGAVEV
jgi:hypothetical protein